VPPVIIFHKNSRKLIDLNFEGLFSIFENVFFGKVLLLEVKKIHGLYDDLKII